MGEDPGTAGDENGDEGGDGTGGCGDDEAAERNPAAVAAAGPEPDWTATEPAARAVGIGPGDPAFLAPAGERALRAADVVVGFETVVDYVADLTDAETLACGYRDEAATLAAFADRVAAGERGVAVLMGDPNHSGYQFLGKVERAVGGPVRVVPGISAVTVAASRARTPLEATTFVTLHRRGDVSDGLDRLRRDVGDRHLLVLPRPFDLMPGDVAAALLVAGVDPDATALVLERLTHDDESITRTTLSALAGHAGGGREGTPFSDLSVLAVRR